MAKVAHYGPEERGALLAYLLISGKVMSIAEVSKTVFISQADARRLVTDVARVVPLCVDHNGAWFYSQE